MKENSKLKRYKDPEDRLKKINDWSSKNYQSFTFRLHKERDKEMINEIKNRNISLPELIKNWYVKSKN